MLKSLKLLNGFDAAFIMDRVIEDEGIYVLVYNMYNRVKKHFSIRIVPVRNRAGR
jgi:hypothetical protein